MSQKPKNKISTNIKKTVNIEEEESSTRAFFWLFIFSLLMFTLPFLIFYSTKTLLLESFEIEGFYNTCWSVLAAVITVNLIISIYIYRAFQQNDGVEDNYENKEL